MFITLTCGNGCGLTYSGGGGVQHHPRHQRAGPYHPVGGAKRLGRAEDRAQGPYSSIAILKMFITSASGQQNLESPVFEEIGNSPPYLNISIIGNKVCITSGHKFPLSLS